MRPPTIAFDRQQLVQSLGRIRDLQAQGVTIVFGHDPQFWDSVPQAPEPLV